MYHENYSVDKIHDMTKIDKWFLYKLKNIVDCTKEIREVTKTKTLLQTNPGIGRFSN